MAQGMKRRSTRQAASQKSSIYAEPDTDDDFEVHDQADYEPEEVEAHAPAPKRRKTVARRAPQTRSKAMGKLPSRVIGKPRKVNSKVLPERKMEFSGPSDGRIPSWTTLPVNILKDIFIFASQPVHGQAGPETNSNMSWLFKVARVCRAFALPALEAYYQSPSFLTSLDPHQILDLLKRPKDTRYIDYNVKVQCLYIDVRQLAYLAHNKPPFDLSALAATLPQLQHMEILHPQYLPPYRLPFKLQRWTFNTDDLFHTMQERGITLKSWRWSRDTVPKAATEDLYSMMATAHQSKLFSHLSRLVVCGFNVADSSEPCAPDGNIDTQMALPGLANSVAKLPALEDLTFISCDVIMNDSLQKLPSHLRRLELSNCLEITSDLMRKFLDKSGRYLRELELKHNPSLNLSFLQSLKSSCSDLELLKIDMQYYSEKLVTNDAEALYDEVLGADEVPTWPASLRHFEMVHAQKWRAQGAENVFRSLIDDAPDLMNLRRLIVHAHINIPWRDRVGFREQWIERLQRVFQRRASAPSPHMGSLRQIREWRKVSAASASASSRSLNGLSITESLAHVQVSSSKHADHTDSASGSEASHLPDEHKPRRSRRVAESQVTNVSKTPTPVPESDSDDSRNDNDKPNWRTRPERYIQGLCEIVDIRIDNQRPRENQWTEGDFLDSEISGDEDYREGAEVGYDSVDEDGYAW